MPGQKEELLNDYKKTLEVQGQKAMAAKLMPGIRFITSDTGIASAKVSALLVGGQHPIHIGSCISVDHRHKKGVADFADKLDQLFAQFGDSVAKLQKLMEIPLDYPVNAMTRHEAEWRGRGEPSEECKTFFCNIANRYKQ